MTKTNGKKMPVHVGIIMDGNRRWAAKRGLGPVDGHRVAAKEVIEPIVERAAQLGIKYLTFWAFSTENWKRDRAEVQGVMRVFREVMADKLERLNEKGVRLTVLGDLSRFPKDIVGRVKQGVLQSAKNSKITVALALNYGGRCELIRGIRRMIGDGVKPDQVDEQLVSLYLDTVGMPDPDLIIRTGGACRLSGFLPWQSVYSEYYFTDILWPDFTPDCFEQALVAYGCRDRRFGGGSFRRYTKVRPA